MTQPNIILFNPDQWRGDVMGHLGNPAAVTPNLDEVVENDGVSFANAFCQNPVCTPSRCSFMSGWYPHVRGHRTMYHMMQKDEPVLLRTLKDHGYFVWWGGKNDLVPGEHGYADYCDVKYEPTRRPDPSTNLHVSDSWRGAPDSDTYYSFMAGKLEPAQDVSEYYDSDWAYVYGALEMIRNRPTDRPFCLYLPLLYPHPPYGVEEPFYSLIDRNLIPERIPAPDWSDKPGILRGIWEGQRMQGWSEERWTELRAVYYGMCARVDRQFGMLMQALKDEGIYDDTAVFFFSDHGDFTGDYGLVEKTQNTFEDCLTRVPFIVKPPADVAVKPGIKNALVELIDLCATVEEWTGIEPEHDHFGQSLSGLIAGKTEMHRDAVFCEGGRLQGETQCMELGSTSTKEEGLYWPRLRLQIQEGPEHTKAVMVRTDRYKYVRRVYEKDELYDLTEDPKELYNRIDDPALQPVLYQMKERLLQFFHETCDVVPRRENRRR